MKRLFKNLSLFKQAFVRTRREAGASLMILLFLTFIFTTVLWFAESIGRPDYTIWDALVWVVVKYVDDPAEIAVAPVTIFGQIIGTLVGVLGIAIFAVPAGLIGSGLLDAMADEEEKKKTESNSRLLHKRFRRVYQSASTIIDKKGNKVSLKGVPRFRTFPHIIMKTGMNDDEIIAAVNNCPDMRLMNSASALPADSLGSDELVVVNFPLNNEYGCCLDRNSDVTIVAPVAVSELGTGSFAFSLAAMGGFNYVSKELTPNPDDPFGFYTMQKSKLGIIGEYDLKEDVESQALHFMADLNALKERSEKAGRNHWFIFILATKKTTEDQVYMWRLATDKAGKLPTLTKGSVRYGSTVTESDEERLQQFYNSVKEMLSKYDVKVGGAVRPIAVSLDNNNVFKSVTKSNIMCRLGGGVSCNALTLRLGYEILVHSSQHLIIAKEIADVLKNIVEPEKEITPSDEKCFMKEGEGFADDFCQSVVFASDPQTLKDMIDRKSKEARERFEHLDLDGNVQ